MRQGELYSPDVDGGRQTSDSLGEVRIPAGARWGPHTERARANFAVGGVTLAELPSLVSAFADVKAASARANVELGVLPAAIGAAVEAAAAEVARGEHAAEFPLPVLQGGGGTSTNMNLNEVIANRASELLGADVHPLDHVNRSQSTNDVYPTALALATIDTGRRCLAGIAALEDAVRAADRRTGSLERLGRTCLQDAVPVPVGAGLRAAASGLARTSADLERALAGLVQVPLGATAVGTGIGAPDGFREVAVRHLAERHPGVEATGDLFDGLQHLDAYVAVASELGRVCLVASKLAADLRLLSSGPHGGLGEAVLPAVQAGSTIMPGKVNPVIPELVLQVGFEVEGARRVVDAAAGAGELELNVMEPAIAASLLPALEKVGRTAVVFAERCLDGLTWDEERMRANLGGSLATRVLDAQTSGYEAAAQAAKPQSERLA